VNNNLNVDNTITYESNQFNTIVIRRFDESTTLGFNLNELQLWVNNENILPSNASTLNAYFANWSDKDTPIQGDTIQSVVRNPNPFLFDEIISSGVEASGSGSTNAVIVKDIPLTIVNDIQAIVLYQRGGTGNVPLAIGLTIELYNTQDDANLLSPLARTSVIERGVSRYRYDFPSIDTYTLGFPSPNASGVYPNSITQIATDFVDLTRDNSTITEQPTIFNAKVNINTDTNITGGLTCDSLTTDDLIVNKNLNVDNVITYDSKKFNTIVVRGPSGISGNTTMSISLIEFQVWVNSVNILPTNVSSVYFSLWRNKDEDIGHYAVEAPERIYDEIISDGSVSNSFGADNNSQDVALVINLNSLINAHDLQSLILYNRVSSQARKDRAIGLSI